MRGEGVRSVERWEMAKEGLGAGGRGGEHPTHKRVG